MMLQDSFEKVYRFPRIRLKKCVIFLFIRLKKCKFAERN